MAINTEKNVYTVVFAAAMVAVVGAILAYLASGLKPLIKENERFEKQQNILYAMGVTQHSKGSDNVFAIANLSMLTGNIGKPGGASGGA